MNRQQPNLAESRAEGWRRAFGTVFLYVALGPPIGGFLYALPAVFDFVKDLVAGGSTGSRGVEALAVAWFVGIAMAFSYVPGILPALAVGALTAIWDRLVGRWRTAASVLFGLAIGALIVWQEPALLDRWPGLLFATMFGGASLACAVLTRPRGEPAAAAGSGRAPTGTDG